MAETEFGVTYDGPALTSGQMPVDQLAPALLALGALVNEASKLAYPERSPPALNVKATDHGSFSVYLTLQSPEAWEQIISLLSSKPAQALEALQALILGPAGVMWLIKKAKGQPITQQEKLESGQIRITLPDGTVIEASPEALLLYERHSARTNARKIVEPLRREGVKRLAFTASTTPELVIEQDDLPSYEPSELDENVLGERTYTTFVTLIQPSFDDKYKWRVSEGGAPFTADLEDQAFRERIRERSELFGDGDRLEVRMRAVQKEVDGKLKEERKILEVLDHQARKDYPQERIDFDEDA